MKDMITVMLVALLLLAAGCKSEIDGKTAAQVSEPTEATAAQAEPAATAEADPAAQPTAVEFDLANSKIEWVGAKVTGDHQGGFKTFTGTVMYGPQGEVTGVKTEIDTTSVFSDTEKLTKHLMSPDFFDVEKFPKSTFESSKIEKLEADTYRVTGLLDLHGVKKEISFPATIKTDATKSVTSAEFTLQRFDFGIAYKGKPDDLIKPAVLMKLHIEAPKPADS